MPTDVFTSDDTWTVPVGVTSATMTAFGAGAGGSSGASGQGGGGGGGGEYATADISVSAGQTYTVTVGTGGAAGAAGGHSEVVRLAVTHVRANGGAGGASGSGGSGGTGGTGDTLHDGGAGGSGDSPPGPSGGGGGGGSGGPTATGGTGSSASGSTGGSGGTSLHTGVGGNGGDDGANGSSGVTPGGGGGGGGDGASGGVGARGEVRIAYSSGGEPPVGKHTVLHRKRRPVFRARTFRSVFQFLHAGLSQPATHRPVQRPAPARQAQRRRFRRQPTETTQAPTFESFPPVIARLAKIKADAARLPRLPKLERAQTLQRFLHPSATGQPATADSLIHGKRRPPRFPPPAVQRRYVDVALLSASQDGASYYVPLLDRLTYRALSLPVSLPRAPRFLPAMVPAPQQYEWLFQIPRQTPEIAPHATRRGDLTPLMTFPGVLTVFAAKPQNRAAQRPQRAISAFVPYTREPDRLVPWSIYERIRPRFDAETVRQPSRYLPQSVPSRSIPPFVLPRQLPGVRVENPRRRVVIEQLTTPTRDTSVFIPRRRRIDVPAERQRQHRAIVAELLADIDQGTSQLIAQIARKNQRQAIEREPPPRPFRPTPMMPHLLEPDSLASLITELRRRSRWREPVAVPIPPTRLLIPTTKITAPSSDPALLDLVAMRRRIAVRRGIPRKHPKFEQLIWSFTPTADEITQEVVYSARLGCRVTATRLSERATAARLWERLVATRARN